MYFCGHINWYSFLGIYPTVTRSLSQSDIWIPIFSEALFTIAKVYRQPGCPMSGEWIKNVWDINLIKYRARQKQVYNCHYTEQFILILLLISYSIICHTNNSKRTFAPPCNISHKRRKPCHCNSTDGPGRHYSKWNKPDKKRQYCMLLHMWYQKTKVEFIKSKMVVAGVWGIGKTGRD